MLLLILGLLLFGSITGINFIGGLFRIFLFFLLLSVIWFLIKCGFYVLIFFAVLYLGIRGIVYMRSYLRGNDKFRSRKRGAFFDDADFVEVVE